VLLNSLPQPSYHAHAARWAQLADADVLAAFQAARSVIPGPSPLPRQQMLSNVLVWMQGQEVALAWAVVKYAELVRSLAAAGRNKRQGHLAHFAHIASACHRG
jgi:hypothetical protein